MPNDSAQVTIYSTPWCVFCHMAKEYLKGKKVEFTEIDVAADQDAARKMVERTGQMGVPVIQIGDEMIIGFDRNRIDLALRDNKLV